MSADRENFVASAFLSVLCVGCGYGCYAADAKGWIIASAVGCALSAALWFVGYVVVNQ